MANHDLVQPSNLDISNIQALFIFTSLISHQNGQFYVLNSHQVL